MKHTLIFLSLIATLLWACNASEAPVESAGEAEQDPPVSVELISQNDRIQIGPIEKRTVTLPIQCTGYIEVPPTKIYSVHSKTDGLLSYLKYLPGDYVKKGALIARVENPVLVEKQRMLQETRAKLELARKDFDRKKILREGNATPQKSFDESQGQFELLSATFEGLKKELQLLGVHVDDLINQRTFQTSVGVYARQSGFVHEVFVNRGQMISPETRLMEIVDTRHTHLELQVLSKDIASIYLGQEVEFTLANRSETFKASVIKINPMIDEGESTLPVHCHIDHPDQKVFVAGLYVNARIKSSPREVEGLPVSAVIKEGEDYFGYRIVEDEVVKTLLEDVTVLEDFIQFKGDKAGQWITAGAYYVE